MVTLKDIAAEAGVSIMTVSNVINGNHSKVSKKTIEK
ncbi:LacI family DNA-binding transcriptional regulator [Clostridium beijerinckii]|nr:LacI family DNA-binding transcriptional regulator [Clostridium beijerinckii]NSA88157.1 DNA-binding LacI/PurR family transcriptional regulator [Clostridium beijerinckii]